MEPLNLAYSLADQDFSQTKSLGIFNLSTQLLESLSRRINSLQLCVLSNLTLENKLQLPADVVVQFHNEAISSKFGRILWDQWGVYKAAKKNNSNWIFLPKGFSAFLRPPALKLAVYVHDAIHDFYRVNYPGFFPWLENKYFTHCLRNTLKYSNIIFTNSDFTKEELQRLASNFKLPTPLIITAGIGFSDPKEDVVQKRNSLLLLTSAWPHKLTKRAVDFIGRWQKQTGFSVNVELVGSLPTGMRMPTGWQHHLRLSEPMYRKLLRESKLLLFFSAYEGFGMPPVEAMIAGTCPVFSDLAVTREVMGGRGFSFSNDSYESFVQAMEKAINLPQAQIRLWAEQLLERHNWDKVINVIINGLSFD